MKEIERKEGEMAEGRWQGRESKGEHSTDSISTSSRGGQ